MSIKKGIVLRVRIAFLLTFLVAAAVIFRIATIQYVEGEQWRSLGETLGMQVMNVKATRGNIYADDGSLLATSLPFYQLAMDPALPVDGLYKNAIDSLSFLLSRYYKDLTPTQEVISLRNLASLIGKLQATSPAISMAPMQVRALQQDLIRGQQQELMYESEVKLSLESLEELRW